jgi:hypothetical protein
LGLTLTGRWPFPGSGEIVFLRFGENRHDFVLMPQTKLSQSDAKNTGNALQHIARDGDRIT